MGSCRDWTPIIGRLQDHFHCIAVDLPGHGQSRCDDPLQFAMPTAAAAVIELLDYLAIGAGGLVGYSMGGRLALYLAVHFPARFSHLVLESSSPGLRTAAERTTRRSWDEAMAHKLRPCRCRRFSNNGTPCRCSPRYTARLSLQRCCKTAGE